MKNFDEIKEAMAKCPGHPLPEDQRAMLLAEAESLPPDYVEFLTTFGCGSIGVLTLYSGPIKPSDLLDEIASRIDHLRLVGDDGDDFFLAFDTAHSCRLVTVDYDHLEVTKVHSISFEQFMLNYLKCGHLGDLL